MLYFQRVKEVEAGCVCLCGSVFCVCVCVCVFGCVFCVIVCTFFHRMVASRLGDVRVAWCADVRLPLPTRPADSARNAGVQFKHLCESAEGETARLPARLPARLLARLPALLPSPPTHQRTRTARSKGWWLGRASGSSSPAAVGTANVRSCLMICCQRQRIHITLNLLCCFCHNVGSSVLNNLLTCVTCVCVLVCACVCVCVCLCMLV